MLLGGFFLHYRKSLSYSITITLFHLEEELEDTKGVIRICKSKERQHNGQKKKNKTTIYNTLRTKD